KADLLFDQYNHAAAELNGYVYAIGGGASGDQVQRYHPGLDRWETAGKLVSGRQFFAAATIGATLYAFEGGGGQSVERFDAGAGSWIATGATVGGIRVRYDYAGAVVGGSFYMFGGQMSVATPDMVDRFTAPATFTPRANWRPRTTYAAAALNGTVYVFGGFAGAAFTGRNEAYDPAGDSLRPL